MDSCWVRIRIRIRVRVVYFPAKHERGTTVVSQAAADTQLFCQCFADLCGTMTRLRENDGDGLACG